MHLASTSDHCQEGRLDVLSLISRPSHTPVFDHKFLPTSITRSNQKLNGGKAYEQG